MIDTGFWEKASAEELEYQKQMLENLKVIARSDSTQATLAAGVIPVLEQKVKEQEAKVTPPKEDEPAPTKWERGDDFL